MLVRVLSCTVSHAKAKTAPHMERLFWEGCLFHIGIVQKEGPTQAYIQYKMLHDQNVGQTESEAKTRNYPGNSANQY